MLDIFRKMKAYFLSVIFVFAWFQHGALEDIIHECLRRELGEEVRSVTILADRLDSTSLESKCYQHCSQEADGSIVNGKIIPSAVKEINYPFSEQLELEKASADCLSIEATGKCELGDQLSACLNKHIYNFQLDQQNRTA